MGISKRWPHLEKYQADFSFRSVGRKETSLTLGTDQHTKAWHHHVVLLFCCSPKRAQNRLSYRGVSSDHFETLLKKVFRAAAWHHDLFARPFWIFRGTFNARIASNHWWYLNVVHLD
jgi:hypothetical protein